MKKFLVMILGMVMVLSMVGCSKSDTPTTTDTTTSVSTESSVEASTETSTETIPHTERVQETVEVESTIDKENACAIDTVYFTVEKAMTTIYSDNPWGGKTDINYYEFDSNKFGKKMKCDVYYFEKLTEDGINHRYEYEISPAE